MLIAAVYGLFGCIIGSFLNVVVMRRGIRSVAGRSGCLSCGSQLHVRDLIPILSWVALGGRCRSCGSGISVHYPLVEGATAFTFACIGGAMLAPLESVLACIVAALFIAIAAYDVRHTIIPDEWAYSAGGMALVYALTLSSQAPLLTLLSGPIAALPLFLLWLVSRGRWMGLGDSKLALGIGWLLGPVYGIYAVSLSFIIGAVLSVVILLPLPYYRRVMRKAGIARGWRASSYTMKSEVPFGPFLILACFYVWFSLLYHIPLPVALF